MELTKPISPNNTKIIFSEYELDEAIQFINHRISQKKWHDEFFVKDKSYHAIILTPAGKFCDVMDKVVEIFKQDGWDCNWGQAYDARGPHHCFYVNKNHFNNK